MSNQISYLPLSIFEKQVYEPHQVLSVLTNKRAINFVQVRPIDQLLAILKLTASAQQKDYTLDDFEDFAVKYTLGETCSMLVQVLSEH